MKHLALIIFSVFSLTAYSQSGYEEAMKAGFDSMRNVKSPKDFVACANYFERIAQVETTEWLPLYYSAYCKVIRAFASQDITIKEKMLNSAEPQIEAALKIGPEEPEMYTLQGMYYQAVIGLDPMNNGQMYSGKSNGALDQAIRLDKTNPRPYYLKAMNIMYTPEEFGGGLNAACPLFSKANELFATYKVKNELYPDWGKEDCANYCSKCSN